MATLGTLAALLPGCTRVGDATTLVSRVHSDTRSLRAGDLFVALQGEQFDGNRFLDQARDSGAAAALCHAGAGLATTGLPGLEVADSLQALGQLATGWRAGFQLPLIAVTGSNGKTTVTQMVAAILSAWLGEAALATQGNLNNDIGVPLTLLRLRPQHRATVVELGMNHPGEIARLAAMAAPTVVLVNNAQREHLEFMHTVDAVAEENGSAIDHLPPDGTAVFPLDDSYAPLWTAKAGHTGARRMLRFALDDTAAEVHCTQRYWADGAWSLAIRTSAGPLQARVRMAGLHNVRNALAATACALAAGAPLAAIAQGLAAFEAVKGRSRVRSLTLQGHTLTLVDDSYNANPDSVQAALAMLATLPPPRLMVLGDMGEVGDQGPAFHAQAGETARALGLESLCTLGTLARHASAAMPGARHFDDADALIAAVREALPRTASVLVKGSRFMRMERVVQAIEAAVPQDEQPPAAHGAATRPGEPACC